MRRRGGVRGVLLAVLALLAAPACADLAAGRAAYDAGDYATAYAEWLPLARRENARARFMFGDMYRLGRGVAQDDAKAVRWYRKAADQGYAPAFVGLSWNYLLAARYQDAVAAAREGLTQDRHLTTARGNLGLALAFLGEHDSAREAGTIALQENAGEATLWAEAGIIANLRGDFDDAVGSFERALELDPDLFGNDRPSYHKTFYEYAYNESLNRRTIAGPTEETRRAE